MSQLKPCPFCGGQPKARSERASEDSEIAWVECQTCEAMTCRFEDAYAPHEQARSEWNRREVDWRPIVTAPKDGTSVLVYVPVKELPVRNAPSSRWKTFAQRVIEVRWIVPPPDDKHVTISPFGRELEAKFGGYWTADPRCIAPLRGMPTHWMPCPTAPVI